jgi:hypothetical protein
MLHLVSVSRGWACLIDWRKESNEHDFRGVCPLSGKSQAFEGNRLVLCALPVGATTVISWCFSPRSVIPLGGGM